MNIVTEEEWLAARKELLHAQPLGRQVGGPGMRLPDEYDL